MLGNSDERVYPMVSIDAVRGQREPGLDGARFGLCRRSGVWRVWTGQLARWISTRRAGWTGDRCWGGIEYLDGGCRIRVRLCPGFAVNVVKLAAIPPSQRLC